MKEDFKLNRKEEHDVLFCSFSAQKTACLGDSSLLPVYLLRFIMLSRDMNFGARM